MNRTSLQKLIVLATLLSALGYFVYREIRQSQAVWPEQDWILFSCSYASTGSDIFRMLPDGGDLTQLTSGDEKAYPHWASKSGWIYFWKGYPDTNIQKMRFDGDSTKSVMADIYPNGFDISPSESFMVFARNTNVGGLDIFVSKIEDDTPTSLSRLTNSSVEGGINWSPVISPDEQWIAYISTQNGNQEIYLAKLDGTEKIRLTETDEDEWMPAWSPDGKWVIFSSGELRDGDIFRVNVLTHEIQPLVIWPGMQVWPSLSPNGEWIIFSSTNDRNFGPSQIYKMRLDGSGLQQLTYMDCSPGSSEWISAHVVESATAEPTD